MIAEPRRLRFDATEKLCMAGCAGVYIAWQLFKLGCILVVWALDR